jgi:hypothetical protein
MTTTQPIEIEIAGASDSKIKIPKGTRCNPATNQPKKNGQKQYWVCTWKTMTPRERQIRKEIGILLTELEIKGLLPLK